MINCVDGGSMGFFFFFLINCVGVLGLHGGDGDDERERKREREGKRDKN